MTPSEIAPNTGQQTPHSLFIKLMSWAIFLLLLVCTASSGSVHVRALVALAKGEPVPHSISLESEFGAATGVVTLPQEPQFKATLASVEVLVEDLTVKQQVIYGIAHVLQVVALVLGIVCVAVLLQRALTNKLDLRKNSLLLWLIAEAIALYSFGVTMLSLLNETAVTQLFGIDTIYYASDQGRHIARILIFAAFAVPYFVDHYIKALPKQEEIAHD